MPTDENQLRRDVSLHDYRLDKHGVQIDDHENRLRVVEDQRRALDVLEERVRNLARDQSEGFEAQGDEIKNLRRAVVAAALSIAGSALILAITFLLQ